MGFFSGITGAQKTKVPASGFYSQPQAYQNLYNNVLDSSNTVNGQVNADMFTPMALTGGESNALQNMGQGFTPTEQSLQQDLSMLQNPFDEYVVNDLNRQSQGQNSLVNQYATQAGQQGSNRSFLGASDVEQNRLNSIGQFRQSQYNTAIDQILNNLVPNRRQDATGALAAGSYERDLNTQTKQAPLNALNAQQGILNNIPTSFGNFGTPAQTIKTGGGLGGLMSGLGSVGVASQGLGGLAGFAGMGSTASTLGSLGSALAMFSDERLKQDIEFIGLENGHKIYEFAYKSEPDKRFVGVMAQDVEELNPKAVREIDGWKAVDYDMIGVRFREVA